MKTVIRYGSSEKVEKQVNIESIAKEPCDAGIQQISSKRIMEPIYVKYIIKLTKPIYLPKSIFRVAFAVYPEKEFYPARDNKKYEYCNRFIEI